MKRTDAEYMRMAIDLAEKNSTASGGGPFGAVIVRNGEILSQASNSVTVCNDPTAHAEVNAIRMACEKVGDFLLEGAVLYSSCEPCPMCLAAAYWAHISRICYAADRSDAAEAGFDDSMIYKEVSLPVSDRAICTERICAEEGKVPFRKWIGNKNKVEY